MTYAHTLATTRYTFDDLRAFHADFTLRNGFSFEHVDEINVTLGDCFEAECPAVVHPVSYALGPILFDQAPTPTAKVTWGAMKLRYR